MDDINEEQPARRERVGGRAWVRTVGLVGGGLMAGGILAGTLTANAATDDSTTSPPSVTQEEGTTTDGTTAPEDCPEGAGGPGGGTTTPDGTTTPVTTLGAKPIMRTRTDTGPASTPWSAYRPSSAATAMMSVPTTSTWAPAIGLPDSASTTRPTMRPGSWAARGGTMSSVERASRRSS